MFGCLSKRYEALRSMRPYTLTKYALLNLMPSFTRERLSRGSPGNSIRNGLRKPRSCSASSGCSFRCSNALEVFLDHCEAEAPGCTDNYAGRGASLQFDRARALDVSARSARTSRIGPARGHLRIRTSGGDPENCGIANVTPWSRFGHGRTRKSLGPLARAALSTDLPMKFWWAVSGSNARPTD